MANGVIELVGDSIQEIDDPTKVPHAGAVASADAGAAGAPAAEGQPPSAEGAGALAPMPIAPGMPAPSAEAQGQYAATMLPMDFVEELPSYADGSSVDAPLNVSPLDIVDRLKMAAGNKVGKLKYLKEKYEDVVLDKSGFKVKKDGAWYTVDPDGLGSGDPWTRTKELAKDAADRVFTGASGAAQFGKGGPLAIATAALGTAVSADALDMVMEHMPETDAEIKKALAAIGVAGATPVVIQAIKQIKANPSLLKGAGKASLAGAGVEAVRTSLGRAFGTYEATPAEQLQDIGFETLLGMGGQLVGLGVKPSYEMVKAAATKVNDTMGTAGKDILSSLLSVSTKEPKWAMRRTLDSPAVLEEAKGAVRTLKPGMDPSEGLDFLQGEQNKELRFFAKEAHEGLQREYRTNLNDLLKATPDTFSADVGRIANTAQTSLAEAGYGKLVRSPGGKMEFQLLNDDEIARMLGSPNSELPKIIGPKTQDALKEASAILNKYAKFGTLSGKQGAQKAIELKRAIRESFDGIIGPETPAPIKQVVLNIKNNLDEGVGQTFADHGVADQFVKMNNAFADKRDAVTMLQNAVSSRNPQEVDNLVKRLASKSGQYKSLKDEAKELANLSGDQGQARMQRLLDLEAAKSWLSFAPKSLEGSSAGLVGRAMGLVTQQSNPRFVAQEIRAARYGAKGLDFLKTMGPKQLDQFLRNDQAVGSWAAAMARGANQESADTEVLLQQAGIPPEGGGQ